MTVLLTTSRHPPRGSAFTDWCAIEAPAPPCEAERQTPNLARKLEEALESVFPQWLALGRTLGEDASAILAHAPTGGNNVSDLGLMLAWTKLVATWAADARTTLVMCDDPWMFRHLSSLPGVTAGKAPPLWSRRLRLALRGVLARTKAAAAMAANHVALRHLRRRIKPGAAALLVYGHPDSDTRGYDAYFSTLMRERPDMVRVLHVDCPRARARQLTGHGRTTTLHAFGGLFQALALVFARWRPGPEHRDGPCGWLVRRAAALEGSTATPAMIRWQVICQRKWLAAARPAAVAWPWENHSWERDFVRAAHGLGVRTIGYQHATFGKQELNHSNRSNPDGDASLPQVIVCNGRPWRDRLIRFGLPEDRLKIGGAWRYGDMKRLRFDPQGAVFVALPADETIAAQMIAAIAPLAEAGWRFLVKDHPLTPIAFAETAGLSRCRQPLERQDHVRVVVYAGTSVGLEALLRGLPAIRFQPTGKVPSEVLPDGWETPTAAADELGAALSEATPPPPRDPRSVFAAVDRNLWRTLFPYPANREPAPPPVDDSPLRALKRKTGHVLGDSVLRRWLIGRATGRHPAPPPFVPHRPPYLNTAGLPREEPRTDRLREMVPSPPQSVLAMALPGTKLDLWPGDEKWVFAESLGDLETWLGLQRFAWLPLAGPDVDGAWVQRLWDTWKDYFGTADGGWAWHPYTAAERAVNLLEFARRHGLPAPLDETAARLADHARIIAEGLEYFGEHHTGNHLANNGRGLFLIGLALGMEGAADRGGEILVNEARRIFRPSGVLREGSSHYHLLVTRWYAGAWLAARRHGRPETEALEHVVRRALKVIPRLTLPAGLPLIGDVSPDCPPDHLAGLVPGQDPRNGWTGLLDPAERSALAALRDGADPASPGELAGDGWLRADFGPWAGLWHAARHGWSPMPGHGHQDCGGFELHFETEPLFIDPGRGAYGDSGEAAYFGSALAHNVVMVDDQDPYPANRPYYGDAFRRLLGGDPPALRRNGDTVSLTHHGFGRLAGAGAVTRRWRFTGTRMTLSDAVEGRGRHRIRRRFHTPCQVTMVPGGVVLTGVNGTYRLSGTDDDRITVRPTTRWRAYGEGEPATVIDLIRETTLPWTARVTVEAVKP